MDERDKDLTGLFVRDLDEIALPPRGAWQRARGRETTAMRTSRYILTVAAIAAVLAIALIVGFQLRDRNATVANPSASPRPELTSLPIIVRPSPTANPNVTATPSAPGGAIYNDDFGFIVTDAGTGLNIHKESSSVTPWIGSFQQQGFAASPDGTRIAYWVPRSPGVESQLKVVSAANPNSLLFSSSISASESGGGIVWSNDSAGLAYAVHTGNPTTGSVIRTLVLSAGGAGQAVISWSDPGRILQPIAWDRAANIIAAGVTGDGGFMTEYLVAKAATPQGAPGRAPVTGRVSMGSVRASTDAKLVVGVDIDTGFSYWPLADYAAKIIPAESKYGSTGALWRPGTHEIGFIGPSKQFWLCNADRNTPLGCGTTAFSGVPDGAFVRTFRADGSAVVLAVPGGGGAQTSYTLVKFTGDPFAAKATGGERVTFTDLGGLSASVRLR